MFGYLQISVYSIFTISILSVVTLSPLTWPFELSSLQHDNEVNLSNCGVLLHRCSVQLNRQAIERWKMSKKKCKVGRLKERFIVSKKFLTSAAEKEKRKQSSRDNFDAAFESVLKKHIVPPELEQVDDEFHNFTSWLEQIATLYLKILVTLYSTCHKHLSSQNAQLKLFLKWCSI